MENLLTISWIIVTILYVVMHHLFNWLLKEINNKIADPGLTFILILIYIVVNGLYFLFTYNVFNII